MPSKPFSLKGGLNLSDSPLDVYPGQIRDGINFYESTDGGYERIGGYERFDGKLSPSAETYYVAKFNNWSAHVTAIAPLTTITAGVLTFYVMAADLDVTTDTLSVYLCALVGTIPDDLDVAPIVWDAGSSVVSVTPRDALSQEEDESFQEQAWEYRRTQVGAIPGTAVPSGVLQIDDLVVAFRNDGSTPKHYYQTSAGWVAGKFGRAVEITSYTAGTVYPGDTFQSGLFEVAAVCDWYDTDFIPVVTKAWLVVIPLSATEVPTLGAATATGGGTFTVASVIQPIASFGSYIESVNNNFLSSPDSNASWIADGKNIPMCYWVKHRAILPVCSNFNTLEDVGVDVAVHAEKLLFTNDKGSWVSSEPGSPFNYGGQYGASVQGVGAVLTGVIPVDSEHVMFFTASSAKRLTGTDKSEWSFVPAASSMGAYPRSIQKLDDVFSFSGRGVSSLVRTTTTGGYDGGSISTTIQEVVAGYRGLLSCSNVVTAKEQIRWYFTDSSFLMMSKLPGEAGPRYSFAIGVYPGRTVRGISSAIWNNGQERTFFTSDTGYMYEADRGTNFDGGHIDCFVELHSNHLGTPGINKSFKRVFFEAQAQNYSLLTVTYNLNYGDKKFETRNIELNGGLGVYDTGLYDVSMYDSADRTRGKATLKGSGFSIALSIEHRSKFSLPFKLTGYTLDYETLGRAIN